MRRILCYETALACTPEAALSYRVPATKTEYVSERPLRKEQNRGPVYRAVGSDVDEQLGNAEHDVLLFVYFAGSKLHDQIGPQFDRFAEIIALNRPPTLTVASEINS